MERYRGTFWATFVAVVLAIAAVAWFASSHTSVGPTTASNEPAAAPPAVKPPPATPTPTTP
jgi:hypothetical protein